MEKKWSNIHSLVAQSTRGRDIFLSVLVYVIAYDTRVIAINYPRQKIVSEYDQGLPQSHSADQLNVYTFAYIVSDNYQANSIIETCKSI